MSPSKPKPTMSKNRRPATRPTSTRTGISVGDRPGQRVRVASQAEMPGHQVFGAGRQNGEGNARLLVEQVRDRAVTADGHQAPAPRVAGGSAHQRGSFLRGPRDPLREAQLAATLGTSRSTRRNPLPMPELRFATTPTQSVSAGSTLAPLTGGRGSLLARWMSLIGWHGGVGSSW